MSLAIIYLEVIIMLIPNDLIKKFNSNCDKNINNLNNKKSLIIKVYFGYFTNLIFSYNY